jgi:hypothetical protein
MIQRQLKLRLHRAQETQLNTWLFHLTGVWNWAIRKIEQDANHGISYSQKAFHNLHELRHTEKRLAQAQRGGHKRLTARLHERLTNQRKDRNHKLSRRLVADHGCLVWSKDHHQAIARAFGKRSLLRSGSPWPVLVMLSFAECSPTSALQAVGSSSKFPRSIPPRPARHAGACLVPLATQAYR